MALRLSACMIVRDEEVDLPRCLASLEGVVDELVVVDTGSVDRTPALAEAAGARLVRRPWDRDFAAARNASLAAATGDWCLVLDADEELPAETRAALRGELVRAQAQGLAALSLRQRNLAPPGELLAWEDLPIVRAFRRGDAARYEGRIHEQVSPSIARAGGRIGASPLHFLHHGYARTKAQAGVDRARRNLALLQEACAEAPADAYLAYQLGVTLKAIGDPAAAAALARALALDEAAPVRALSDEAVAGTRLRLAQLALGRGADEVAVVEAGRCLAVQPANPTALQILVVGCVSLGRLDEARRACRALLACPNLAAGSRREAEQLARALGA